MSQVAAFKLNGLLLILASGRIGATRFSFDCMHDKGATKITFGESK